MSSIASLFTFFQFNNIQFCSANTHALIAFASNYSFRRLFEEMYRYVCRLYEPFGCERLVSKLIMTHQTLLAYSIFVYSSAYKSGRGKDPSEGWYKGELWFFDNYIM